MGSNRAARLVCANVLAGLVLTGCGMGLGSMSDAAKAPGSNPLQFEPRAPGEDALRFGVWRRNNNNTGTVTVRIRLPSGQVVDKLTYSLDPPRLVGHRRFTFSSGSFSGSMTAYFRWIGDQAWFRLHGAGNDELATLFPQCWLHDSAPETLAREVGVSPSLFYSRYPTVLAVAYGSEGHEKADDGTGEVIGTADLAEVAYLLYVWGASLAAPQVEPGDERVAGRFRILAGTLTRMEFSLHDVMEGLGDDKRAYPLLTLGGRPARGTIVVTFESAPDRIRVAPPPRDQVQKPPRNVGGIVPVMSASSCANPPG